MRTSRTLWNVLAGNSHSIPHLHSRSSTIGFIGLGAMGKEMASNLLSKTCLRSTSSSQDDARSFVIHDHSEQSMSDFFARHSHLYPPGTLITATTPASVARQASTIITMLPASVAVKEVYLNSETGIIAGLQSSGSSATICIDCTTLDRADGIQVAEQISMNGKAEMLDAPVSGGVVGAREGTLSFMCGGDRNTFEKGEPLLSKMGRRSVYCGASGSGLSAKIANNLLLAISMIGTAEAFLLGTKLGLQPEVLSQIVNTSTGRCWSSEVNNPVPGALLNTIGKSTPADEGYRTGFKSSLMSKDLSLACSAAEKAGLKLPLLGVSSKIYEKLTSDVEFGGLDFSVVFKWLEIANADISSQDGSGQAREKHV